MRPFPNVGDGQWPVSNTGGSQARWARNGRELFYRTADGALMVVSVNPRGTTWSGTSATKLFDGGAYTGGGLNHYDVSLDGQRFLMIKDGAGSGRTDTSATLVVVLNWIEELKRLVPSN